MPQAALQANRPSTQAPSATAMPTAAASSPSPTGTTTGRAHNPRMTTSTICQGFQFDFCCVTDCFEMMSHCYSSLSLSEYKHTDTTKKAPVETVEAFPKQFLIFSKSQFGASSLSPLYENPF